MEGSLEKETTRRLDEGRAALTRAAAVERSSPDEALALADGVLALTTSTSNPAARHLHATAHWQRARALIFRRDLAAAGDAATAAESIFIELGDTDGVVRARTTQGAVFSALGHDEAALELLEDSALLSRSPAVSLVTRLRAITSRASAMRDAGRAEEALVGFEQSLSIARELRKPDMLGALFLNEASAAIRCRRLERAERTLAEARATIHEHALDGLRGWLVVLQATLALALGDFQRARALAAEGIDAGGDRDGRVNALRTWAQAVYFDPAANKAEIELARVRLVQLVEEARAREWLGDLPAICRDLADLHERTGDTAESLRWQKEAWTARDLADRSRRMQRLEAERLRLELTRLTVQAEQHRLRSEMLAETNERLATLSEERARLLAMVAHDLRSPLTAICVCVEHSELTANATAEKLRGTLQIIGLATERMTALIDGALSTESIRRGHVSPRAHRVDLANLLSRCIAGLSPLAERKAIRVQFEMRDAVVIDTDAPALSRIVENLLTNALKFTPSGKVIHVTLQHDGSWAALEIADEGPGFLAAELDTLFELGAKGAAQPTAGEASSGIGLSVVRDLASALGGEVKLSNRDLGGARVTVRLPATQRSS